MSAQVIPGGRVVPGAGAGTEVGLIATASWRHQDFVECGMKTNTAHPMEACHSMLPRIAGLMHPHLEADPQGSYHLIHRLVLLQMLL